MRTTVKLGSLYAGFGKVIIITKVYRSDKLCDYIDNFGKTYTEMPMRIVEDRYVLIRVYKYWMDAFESDEFRGRNVE